MSYCHCLLLSYIVHQRCLIYWKKRICSDNVVLQILARRCFNDVRALCDIYKISVYTLTERSVHYVKDLFMCHFISSFDLEYECIVVYRCLFVYCVPCMFLMLLYEK